MVRKHRVEVLLLQETKVSKDMKRIICNIWGTRRGGWQWVPSEGASGGLICIWNEEHKKSGGAQSAEDLGS